MHKNCEDDVKGGVRHTPEYRAVAKYYGESVAVRSGVPLINHINEGLDILELLAASKDAMRAWCLHPLFQEDVALSVISQSDSIFSFSPRCVMLAMEYRDRANGWLSDKVYTGLNIKEVFQDGNPSFGILLEVRGMLVADKVQNYKDFLRYHYGKHERSEELNHYFLEWFKVLAVDEMEYDWIVKQISG